MKKSLMSILAFAAGGVVGFVAADRMMKQKYEQIVQDEVESIKAAFRKEPSASEKESGPAAAEASESEPKAEDDKPTEQEREQYRKAVAELGYTKEEKPPVTIKPRVITPDEFGCLDAYEQISLTYYADGTVADDDDRAMSKETIEETIGRESLRHFGEYEEDSVFVRNDRLKVDYEILLDARTYGEVLQEKPYLKHLG